LSPQKDKLIEIILDKLTHLNPIIDSDLVERIGSSRIKLVLDGKKLQIEVFD